MTNEKRLIDANAIKYREHVECHGHGLYETVRTVTDEEIAKMPTVDAVEVVRCGECRWARAKDHREPTDTPKQLICQCFKHHHIPAPWGARLAVNPDDFCSYGERKTNGSCNSDRVGCAGGGDHIADYENVRDLRPEGGEMTEMSDKYDLICLLSNIPCESELEGQPGSCSDRRHGQCREIDKLSACAVSRIAEHLLENGVTLKKNAALTLEELRKMDGQKVYCLDVNTEVTVHAPRVGLIYVSCLHYVLKATEVTLYRTRPGRDENA